jgi:spore coat protein H
VSRATDTDGRTLGRYRDYLLLHASLHPSARLRVKLDASDIIQQVFPHAHAHCTQFKDKSETDWLARLSSMSGRFPVRFFALCCLFLVLTLLIASVSRQPRVAAGDPEPALKADEAKNSFGQTKVWTIHLEIPAKEFDAMQPALGGGFGPPPKKEEKKDDKKRESEKNLFGTDFPWVEADFTADGKTLKKVGVRYAGDITYFVSTRGLKRPLKIAFDKFGDQQFKGLSAVQLHAMPLDPSKAREVLAYAIFRAAGVPAPRTAFAEITLTVPDKHDKEYLGLFTVVENVDANFLAHHFGSGKGLAMKPFRVRGIDALGDDWERYKGQYQPQREATKDEAKRVMEFAKLVNQASDDEFKKQIGSFIDVDAFLRFLAANALTSNLESFFALGHNYTLYLDPKTNKFHFIPGDLEFSLANFLLMGSADQLMDLNVTKPYPGENKLPDRLLAIKDVNEKYLKLLKELTATVFTKDQLLKDAEGGGGSERAASGFRWAGRARRNGAVTAGYQDICREADGIGCRSASGEE